MHQKKGKQLPDGGFSKSSTKPTDPSSDKKPSVIPVTKFAEMKIRNRRNEIKIVTCKPWYQIVMHPEFLLHMGYKSYCSFHEHYVKKKYGRVFAGKRYLAEHLLRDGIIELLGCSDA